MELNIIIFQNIVMTERSHSTFYVVPLSTECFILCALARYVWCVHFVQDTTGSVGSGPKLLLSLSPSLSRTHPALPLGQLLPYLPSSAGPVPRPGWGWGSSAETDQRKVRVDRRVGGLCCSCSFLVHMMKSRSCGWVVD